VGPPGDGGETPGVPVRMRLFHRRKKAETPKGPPVLVCDYQHSGFRYFTRSKLEEARTHPFDSSMLAAIDAALKEKDNA
jgi:hypothetical protein